MGGGCRGSDISGSREVAHRPAASFAGLEAPAWARAVSYPVWHGVRVGTYGLSAVSNQVGCPSIVSAEQQPPDKDAKMQFTQAFLGFAHLKVIDNLLNTVDTTS